LLQRVCGKLILLAVLLILSAPGGASASWAWVVTHYEETTSPPLRQVRQAVGPGTPCSVVTFRRGVVEGSAVEAHCKASTRDPGRKGQTAAGTSLAEAAYTLQAVNEWCGSGPPVARPVALACVGTGEESVALSCSPQRPVRCSVLTAGYGRAESSLLPGMRSGFVMRSLRIDASAAGNQVIVATGDFGPAAPDQGEHVLNAEGTRSLESRRVSDGPVSLEGRARYRTQSEGTVSGMATTALPVRVGQSAGAISAIIVVADAGCTASAEARSHVEIRIVPWDGRETPHGD
jgi:hypothetical protein